MPITTQSTGFFAHPIEHGRHIAPPDGEREHDSRARTRSTTRQMSAASGAGSHRSRCHRRWRPWLAAALLLNAVHVRSARRHSDDGAQDRRTGLAATSSLRRSHRQRPITRRANTAFPPPLGQPLRRVQTYVASSARARSTSWPAAHRSTRRTGPKPGRMERTPHQHGDNGDSGRLNVVDRTSRKRQ